jgi:hypothetical protein
MEEAEMATDARSLPLLEEPLEPGLTTLDGYAGRHQVSVSYIQSYWAPRPRFPNPVGQLPGRGRHGGGRTRKVFCEQALDDFRAGEPDLQPRTVARLVTDLAPDAEVTLGYFADHSEWESGGRPARKTITQYRRAPGFPLPVRTAGPARRTGTATRSGREKFKVRALLDFYNSRPGRKAPAASSQAGAGRPTGMRGRAA